MLDNFQPMMYFNILADFLYSYMVLLIEDMTTQLNHLRSTNLSFFEVFHISPTSFAPIFVKNENFQICFAPACSLRTFQYKNEKDEYCTSQFRILFTFIPSSRFR